VSWSTSSFTTFLRHIRHQLSDAPVFLPMLLPDFDVTFRGFSSGLQWVHFPFPPPPHVNVLSAPALQHFLNAGRFFFFPTGTTAVPLPLDATRVYSATTTSLYKPHARPTYVVWRLCSALPLPGSPISPSFDQQFYKPPHHKTDSIYRPAMHPPAPFYPTSLRYPSSGAPPTPFFLTFGQHTAGFSFSLSAQDPPIPFFVFFFFYGPSCLPL